MGSHPDYFAVVENDNSVGVGNGRDSLRYDKNGYVDDIHGWNFIPDDKNGKVRELAREADRVYLALSEKIERGEILDKREREQYKQLLEISSLAQEEARYKHFINRMSLLHRIDSIIQVNLKEKYGENFIKRNVSERFINWESIYFYTLIDRNYLQKKDLEFIDEIKALMMGGISWNSIKSSYEKTYLNTKKTLETLRKNACVFEREDVGDNYLNLKDQKYGVPYLKNNFDFQGTHVSGTIAADQIGEYPAIGIAPEAKIMGIKAVSNGDEYDKDVALAIRYAVDNGARVINMSFGKPFSEHSEWVDKALDYAAKHNVLVCHSAGNDGHCYDEQLSYPLPFNKKGPRKNMLTVGNSKAEGIPANNSNWGKKCVDLFAPGSLIYSTYSNNQYKNLSGTSMATPVVSGVAALILTYFPELSAKEVKQILVESAVTPFAIKPFYSFVGGRSVYDPKELCRSGGILNARVAVEKAAALAAKKK